MSGTAGTAGTAPDLATGPDADQAAVEPAGPWRVRHVVAAVLSALACAAVLGQLPGQVPYLPLSYSLTGQVDCVAATGLSAWRGCPDLGVPIGLPMLTAGPLVLLGALISALPGVGVHAAAQVALALGSGTALGATALLLRRLGTGPAVAVAGGAAWLLTPTVVGLRFFNGTWTCLTLLPAFLLADLLLLDRLRRPRTPRALAATAALVAGYTAVRCTAFFLDGYGFVVSAFTTGVVLLLWPLAGGWRPGTRAAALATAGVANAVALLAYRAYVPPGAATLSSPLSQFRALGADVTTFVMPSPDVWWAELTGLARSSVRMWGDGTNADANYLGLLCTALAVAGVLGPLRRRGTALPLAVVAGAALLLSLGPSVKVDAERDVDRPVEHTFEWYDMPPEAATVGLPTAALHETVPGLSSMRATYRWTTATRMVLVLAAAVAVDAALRRSRTRRQSATVVAVAGLAVLELLPPVPRLLTEHADRRDQLTAVHDGPVADLRRALAPGDLVLFLPAGNDYLANYLVPVADVRSYNVGGDKNANASRARYPGPVTTLVVAQQTPDADVTDEAVAVLEDHADAIVLPRFSLRRDARSWPPELRVARPPYDGLFDDDRLTVDEHPWMVVVRLAPGGGQ